MRGPMQSGTPSNARLMKAFNFAPEELDANRAGAVTQRQRALLDETARLGGCASRVALLTFCGLAAVLAGVALFGGDQQGLAQARPMMLLTALFVAVGSALFVVNGQLQTRRLRQHQVRLAEGVAACTTKTYQHGRYTAYYLTLGGLRLQLQTQEQYRALQQGRRYRVYYVHYPPAHLIMSLEDLA